MTSEQKYATSTSVIAAGWVNPTNAYTFDNSYAYSETDTAEQEYDGYGLTIAGNETIDKVFAVLKHKTLVTVDTTGDTATGTCSLKVYNGSTWQTYQVTAQAYSCSTTNDESFTASEGDDSNSQTLIDLTSFLDTPTKINSAKTRLLSAITETKTITLLLAGYVNCVAGDVGKTVTDDGVAVGTLASYDNVARTWVITTSAVIADGSIMAITAGTGAGTTTGAATGTTIRWSVDAVGLLACHHPIGGVFIGAAKTKRDLETKEAKAIQTVTTFLEATA